MPRKLTATLSALFIVLFADFTHAQYGGSGSRTAPAGTRTAPAGTRTAPAGTRTDGSNGTARGGSATQNSADRAAMKDAALEGYCTVSLRDMRKWVRGQAEHSVVHEGRRYYFPGPEQKAKFLADPDKYVPVLDGDCPTSLVDLDQRIRGDLNYGVDRNGKFYFFASAELRQKFLDDKPKYETALAALQREAASPADDARDPSTSPAASVRPAVVKSKTALAGYCTVSLKEMKKWVRGDDSFSQAFDDQEYLFPGREQLAMFQADPMKYAPVLGGDCTVCLKDLGRRISGNVRYAVYHKGRLYLFPGEAQKEKFKANPAAYEDADLALGGDCAVCLVDLNQRIAGKPEFTAMYDGLRYQFPGEDQIQKFLSDPEKYKVAGGAR